MKQSLTVLLIILFLLSASLALPAWADTFTQDGLVVTLSTDKESYDPRERIQATLTVTNLSNSVINNVQIDHLVPNGYLVDSGEITKQVQSLEAGATITLAATYAPIEVALPQTGDNNDIMLWSLLLIIGIACSFLGILLNKKSRKHTLSLLLFVSLVCPIAYCTTSKAVESEKKHIDVSQNVMIGEVNLVIGATVTYSGLQYRVDFVLNYEGATDAHATQYIASGQRIAMPEEPLRDGYVFYAWSFNPNSIAWIDNGVDFDTYLVHENIVLYAIWGREEEDIDGDGLSHKEEVQHNTDSLLYDTDADGLSDGDEIQHGTDPLKLDTDGDGLEDGLEVYLGLNPLQQKSDNSIVDAQRIVDTSFETFDDQFILSLSATPVSIRTFSVDTFDLNNLEDSTGLVSRIVSINYDKSQSFSNAKLVFNYSNVDLGEIDPESLSFLYLNEATGNFDVVPSQVDKNKKIVICTPTHFSCYVVGILNSIPSSFSYTNGMTLEHNGSSVQVREIVASEFDVRKHAFAFHNFQLENAKGGFCYGFTFTTYLNYMEKLPISGETYTNFILQNAPSYNLSNDLRFYTEQLYDASERELFTADQDYIWGSDIDDSKAQMLHCIIHWHGKQHHIIDQLFTESLSEPSGMRKLLTKLQNDEPVPLYLPRWGGAHSVLACGLYRSLDNNDYYLSIYDSNLPGSMSYIKIDLNTCFIDLEYGKYKTFNVSYIPIPEGPYVPHHFNVFGKVINYSDIKNAQGKVTIYNDDFEKSVIIDSAGEYSILEIPNGTYQAVIEVDGFNSVTINDIQVNGMHVILDDIVLQTLPTNYFTYEVVEDRYIRITGYIGPSDADIVIPSYIDGFPVEEIGDGAFYNRVDLVGGLVLPNTLKTIGSFAFGSQNDWMGFTGDLIIPSSVTTIKEHAFQCCAYFDGELVLSENLVEIPNYAFTYCYGFKGDLVIPEKVKRIGDLAFNGLGCNAVIIKGDLEYVCPAYAINTAFNTIEIRGDISYEVLDNMLSLFQHDYVIKGYSGSDAERYASDKGKQFIAIEE